MLLQQSSDCRMRVPSSKKMLRVEMTQHGHTGWHPPWLLTNTKWLAQGSLACLGGRAAPRLVKQLIDVRLALLGAGAACLGLSVPSGPPSCWSSAACLGPERPLRSSPGPALETTHLKACAL